MASCLPLIGQDCPAAGGVRSPFCELKAVTRRTAAKRLSQILAELMDRTRKPLPD